MRGVLGSAAVALALIAAAPGSADAYERPVNLTPPTIVGEASLGGTLTTDGGTWQSAYPIARTYVWQACDAEAANCTSIRDENGASYVPKYFQIKPGGSLRVGVTAWNIGGGKTAYSSTVTVRGATAVMLEAPQVAGDARVGGTLVVSDGSWRSVEPWFLTRRWLRCWPDAPSSCSEILYGRDRTFVVGPYDAGWLVRAEVTANTPSGATAVITSPVAIPGPPPLRLAARDPDLGFFVLGRRYDLPLWTGGTAPYSLADWGGAPPSGMSVTPSGHLVGRPDTPQDSTFGGDVTDGNGAVAREIRFQFRVIPVFMARHKMTAFAVNLIGAPPSTGPCARVGNTQPQAPTLNGEVAGWDMQVGKRALIPFVQFGVPPYTFCTLAGALPPGLAFDSASGMIRGTPTRPGGYTVAIAVADAMGVAGPSSITIGFVVAPKPPPKRKHTP